MQNTIGIISIFSGSAQFDLATHRALRRLGFEPRTVCYIESSKAAQKVIVARIKDGLLEDAPIFPDVRDVAGSGFKGIAQAATACFPCQPFSVAGKRAGKEDSRYLFGEVVRMADEAGLELILMENVPGLLAPIRDKRERTIEPAPISDVSRLLAESGFRCQWLPLAAEDLGSPHGRERWWACAWRQLEHAQRVGPRQPKIA